MQDGKEKGDDYRDDPKAFGKSSDSAHGASTSRTAGGGPTDSTNRLAGEKGSQSDWRGPQAAGGEERGPGSGTYGDVPSRSADPGQSSYGGFKDEGPVPDDVLHAQKPESATDVDASDDGDIAQSSFKVAASSADDSSDDSSHATTRAGDDMDDDSPTDGSSHPKPSRGA